MFCQFWQKFSKIPKNGGHFGEFSKFFAKNGKTLHLLLYSLTVRDRAISAKSLYRRTVKEYLSKFAIFANFGKIFSPPQNGGHFWEFLKIFCQKMAKIANLLLYSCNRVEIERFRRNRSISHRVSKEIEAN